MRRITIVTSVLLFITGCSQQTTGERSDFEALLIDQIQPRYTALVQQSENYSTAIREYCFQPNAERLEHTRENWRSAMLSWQSAETVSQLMLAEDMEGWRFQFWPDKKNLTGRKVKQRVQQSEPLGLMSDSVILQGFSASEYLLFDSEVDFLETNRIKMNCVFLEANASAIVTNSTELQNRWINSGSYQKRLLALESETGKLDMSGWVLNTLDVQIARLKRELSLPLGKKRPNLYLAESWRSQQSLQNIRESLTAMLSMVALTGARAGNEKQIALWADLSRQIIAVQALARQLPDGFSEAIDSGKLNELRHLEVELKVLGKQVVSGAKTLNVALGFNASDGD